MDEDAIFSSSEESIVNDVLHEPPGRKSHEDAHSTPTMSEHDVGLRRVIRHFTPSWFSVTMGTGIVSMLLYTLPYNGYWLWWISVVIFVFNVFLFVVGLILSILRYTIYPETFVPMITHPVQSLFIGTFPMGLATIISMFCDVCVPAWGNWARNAAWGMWIFDAAVSVITALSLPWLMMSNGVETQLSSMTAVWLLPIVSCVVAASTGAAVSDALINPQHALWTILASYILWGIGLPLALMVMAIYFQRLTLHKLPPKAVIVSVFLPLGPLGQGSYGVMKLGNSAMRIFPQTDTFHESAGPIFYTVGCLIALILWAFALVWLFFASASIASSKKFPFNIGWWGFTFPLGTVALSTCQLGRELPSTFFSILGTIVSLCVVLLWIIVSIGTLRGVVSGSLFYAPCLAEMKGREERNKDATKAA